MALSAPPPLARVRGRTHRLIASRFPTIGVFDSVATPEDAKAAMLLETWTNDRANAVLDRMALLPEGEWVLGQPGATLIMAAFFHPARGGGRFNAESLGAWYASRDIATAIAETVYHHTRRLGQSAMGFDATIQMRELVSRIDARLDDIRGWRRQRAALYDAHDYAQSQKFGEARRAAGSAGIVYQSVRRPGGQCLAIYRPRLLPPVVQGDHYDYRWTGAPEPQVVKVTHAR